MITWPPTQLSVLTGICEIPCEVRTTDDAKCRIQSLEFGVFEGGAIVHFELGYDMIAEDRYRFVSNGRLFYTNGILGRKNQPAAIAKMTDFNNGDVVETELWMDRTYSHRLDGPAMVSRFKNEVHKKWLVNGHHLQEFDEFANPEKFVEYIFITESEFRMMKPMSFARLAQPPRFVEEVLLIGLENGWIGEDQARRIRCQAEAISGLKQLM